MKAKSNAIPNPPADVLALFDQMPPDLMEQIQFQMIAYSMDLIVRFGREPNEKEFHKLMLRSQDEFCRLIRKAANEAGISV